MLEISPVAVVGPSDANAGGQRIAFSRGVFSLSKNAADQKQINTNFLKDQFEEINQFKDMPLSFISQYL